ncbi:hypothetical protein FNH22_13770 [Fulvivirga sp. M361]|uniref:hypothetical protein n=1 Tax=Fulvivirga sp. M361 TaxID=2594266 RepID=UPI00117BA966|nr:hypothetical protein [Fulvivirga sp. M361]TRX58412.1 hypothetical protein FNH22_13770 [Fulvivirga sp. M361]
MKKEFDKLIEHILIPVVAGYMVVIAIAFIYTANQWFIVSSQNELVVHYAFKTEKAATDFVRFSFVSALLSMVFLALSFLAIQWKKKWFVVLIILFGNALLLSILLK